MNYESFLEQARVAVKNRIPVIDTEIRQVDKLQNESYKGLLVRFKGSDVGVTMNLTNAYEAYRNQPNLLPVIINGIVDDVRDTMRNLPRIEPSKFMDYSISKDKLLMQVIPKEQNAGMLKEVPHKVIGDIAVVYRIDVSDSKDRGLSMLVTNPMLKDLGVTQEQLHKDAVTSQLTHCPPTLKNLSEVLAEITGLPMEFPESPMWVASVEGGMYGAAVTQLPDFLDMAAEVLKGDFYILPSSIHECLFVPDDGSMELSDLKEMVRTVNKNEVSEADYLSDSVYHYDSLERIFEKADTFEARVAETDNLYMAAGEQERMHVLLVEPDRRPVEVSIGTRLGDLQAAVGGLIEVTYPFNDDVAIIMNEEGKLNGLPLNRALRDENGDMYDIVAGSFLVAGLTEDSFGSLTPEQMAKYEEKFHDPEIFVRMGKGIAAIPVPGEVLEQKTGLSELKQDSKREEAVR